MINPHARADDGSPTLAPHWAPAPPAQWGPATTGPRTPERRRRVSGKA